MKKFATALCVAALAVTLTACGGNGGSNEPGAPDTPNTPGQPGEQGGNTPAADPFDGLFQKMEAAGTIEEALALYSEAICTVANGYIVEETQVVSNQPGEYRSFEGHYYVGSFPVSESRGGNSALMSAMGEHENYLQGWETWSSRTAIESKTWAEWSVDFGDAPIDEYFTLAYALDLKVSRPGIFTFAFWNDCERTWKAVGDSLVVEVKTGKDKPMGYDVTITKDGLTIETVYDYETYTISFTDKVTFVTMTADELAKRAVIYETSATLEDCLKQLGSADIVVP